MLSVSNPSVLGINNFSISFEKKTNENFYTCNNFCFKVINVCIYYPTNVYIDDWDHKNTTEIDKSNNNSCDLPICESIETSTGILSEKYIHIDPNTKVLNITKAINLLASF
jgi:hypothetical protein